MPTKTRNKRIAMPIQAALNMLMKETCFRVLGILMTMPMIVTMTENITVHML
jgi:hypothetical protein